MGNLDKKKIDFSLVFHEGNFGTNSNGGNTSWASNSLLATKNSYIYIWRSKWYPPNRFVKKIRREGKSILFVGTKDQAAEAIKERALASQSFFVNKHWLGGILTNWSTVKVSLSQLYRLEREQKEGAWSHKKKKEVSRIEKRLNSLTRYFDGLKGLQSLPGIVIIVGQTTEIVAIRECRKLGIPVICRLDTDCNPDLVEVGVPINDDSKRSIRLFLEAILPRIHEGQRQRAL